MKSNTQNICIFKDHRSGLSAGRWEEERQTIDIILINSLLPLCKSQTEPPTHPLAIPQILHGKGTTPTSRRRFKREKFQSFMIISREELRMLMLNSFHFEGGGGGCSSCQRRQCRSTRDGQLRITNFQFGEILRLSGDG